MGMDPASITPDAFTTMSGMTTTNSSGLTASPSSGKRLLSLDALRGFDMFWIIGGQSLFPALFALTGWGFWKVCQAQAEHAEWHGFTFEDLIFPLFIFLSGVTLGLSPKRLDYLPWVDRRLKYWRASRRLFLLVALGVLFNHGWGEGLPNELKDVRFASVLGRIGFAWFFAAMLVWHTSFRTQVIVAIGVLLGYWVLLMYIPVPGHGAGVLTHEGTWNAWFDQHFLPGKTYRSRPYDPEGLLSIAPAAVNALLGSFAGRWLADPQRCSKRKVIYLLVAGLGSLALGWLWHPLFPVNKEIWTSSFTLVTCGWSAILLAFFYLVVDVIGCRWLGWPLAVIGANAILIYLSASFVNWSYTVESVFGGFIRLAPESSQAVLGVIALLLVKWLVLAWMYRNRLFIRV